MIPVLDRFLDGSTSNPQRFEHGELLRSLILRSAPKNGVFTIFLCCLFYPFGAHMLEAFASLSDEELGNDVLYIKSPMERHNKEGQPPYVIPLLNPFKHISLLAFRRFRKAATDRQFLRDRIQTELGVPLDWSFRDICTALEAILAIRHPPLLISIFNFTKDAVQPTTIDLSLTANVERKQHARAKLKYRYPLCQKLIRNRTRKRHQNDALWTPSREDLDGATVHDRVVTEACIAYLNAPIELGSKRPDLLTVERYLYLFRYAYESLSSGERLSYIGDAEEHAITLFSELVPFPDADIDFLKKKDRPRARLLALTNPLLVEREYGLNRPYPDLGNSIEAAMRVILIILFNCGRRARCLLDVQLKHFQACGRICDLVIPTTKVTLANGQRVPLSRLLSPADLDFVLSWLENLRKTQELSQETYLFDLLGIFRVKYLESDLGRSKMVEVFSRVLGKHGLALSTHLPRHTFVTWFAVRALLAHYPALRNHPILRDCIDHPWFSEEGLAAFRQVVPSRVSSASCAILPIIGHFLPTESRRSYGRAWSLLATLRASLLSAEAAVEFDKA